MTQTLPIRLVVTHPGRAHRDDAYACGLLLALAPQAALERRHPMASDLEDPTIAVVDVGGRHEPARLNFDHHQFAAEAEPSCALTLVLRWAAVEDIARAFWPWLEGLEWLDSRGPTATARRFTPGTPARQGLLRMVAPAEDWLLRQFEAGERGPVRGVGEMLLRDIQAIEERFRVLDERALWREADGLCVLDTRDAIPANARPEFGVDAWCRFRQRVPAIVVAQSPREPGAANMVRVDDHPRVDFRRLAGHPRVSWIHANGFLASARPTDAADLRAMIHQAVAPP